MFDGGPLRSGQDVSGGRSEEPPSRFGVGSLYACDVDDSVDPLKRVIETFPGEHIDAARAGNHDWIVLGPAQCLDRVPTCQAGTPITAIRIELLLAE
jgi:hypothetical protein